MKVTALRADGKIGNEVLLELGCDEKLDKYLIVCLWKDDTASVGWSDDMECPLMVWGAKLLQREVDDFTFGG